MIIEDVEDVEELDGIDGLQVRVEQTLDSLGPTGRRVATALLAEADRLGFLTAAQIGGLADTTDATVVRTIQRLGYRGLADLKRSLLVELTTGDVASRFAYGDDHEGHSAIDQHLADAASAVGRLQRPEIRISIENAADRLHEADRIVVVAAGPTGAVAEYAAAQWQRIGRDTRTATGPAGPGADDIARIAPSDTVVLMASGKPRRWARTLVETVTERRVSTVVLTDSLPAPGPDAVVVRSGRGPVNRPATHAATLAAVEAITARLAELDPDRTAAALDRLTASRRRLEGR
ncbi:MAG: MurR/RpiR family transcriptional regulator [Actinomycetota bacterium]